MPREVEPTNDRDRANTAEVQDDEEVLTNMAEKFRANHKRGQSTSQEEDDTNKRQLSERIKNRVEALKQKHLKEKEEENIKRNKAQQDRPILYAWMLWNRGVRGEMFKKYNGFYVVVIPGSRGKRVKVGKLYGTTLGDRLVGLTALCPDQCLHVRFLYSGSLTEDAVLGLEDLAKFVLFLQTVTNEEGLVQSRYVGSGEVYEAEKSDIDNFLPVLVNYATDGTLDYCVGDGITNVTAQNFEGKSHPMWPAFIHKTRKNYANVHTHSECPWNRGDENGDMNDGVNEEDWKNWITFARDPDTTCECFN